jgi:GNAT superfamily N-acetyltransferase
LAGLYGIARQQMFDIKFNEEKFTVNLYRESLPLLIDHYNELATHNVELDPDVLLYLQLTDLGIFKVYTARLDSKLIGYNAFFVKPHIHYKGELLAQNDIIFLDYAYRGTKLGKQLILYTREELKKLGATLECYHVKEKLNFGPLLEHLGSELTDHLYVWRLN